jgi:hypothetical protein
MSTREKDMQSIIMIKTKQRQEISTASSKAIILSEILSGEMEQSIIPM